MISGFSNNRNSRDRQFFYINNRSCDFEKLRRKINKMYKKHRDISPLMVICLKCPIGSFDINVTPDKRTIFLNNEDFLIEKVLEYLDKVFEEQLARMSSQLDDRLYQSELTSFSQRSSSYYDLSSPMLRSRSQEYSICSPTSQRKGEERNSFSAESPEKIFRDSPLKSPNDGQKLNVTHYIPRLVETSTSAREIATEFQEDSCEIEDTIENTIERERDLLLEIDEETECSLLEDNKEVESDLLPESTNEGEFDMFFEPKKLLVESPMTHIGKEEFTRMKVVGQFNLGFIITELKQGDSHHLLIIDQHAADEKFRYEMYMRETVLQTQPLLKPITVELSVSDELFVQEHFPEFARNGFHVKFDEERIPTQRIQLCSLPFTRNTFLKEEDFHDLLSQMKEHPQKDVKCSKIHSIMASRACRSAVMVGDALDLRKMESIVSNLATLDKPWNCPHGRPTMRYLTRLG